MGTKQTTTTTTALREEALKKAIFWQERLRGAEESAAKAIAYRDEARSNLAKWLSEASLYGWQIK